MSKLKKTVIIVTAVEAVRQWAHNNPEQARTFIDRATGFVDHRTGGKYASQISTASAMAKKNLTQGQGSRPVPDMRA